MDVLLLVAERFGKDLSFGRMFESFILLAVIWSRLRPHLKKIEDRMLGFENAIKVGFDTGNKRFEGIEGRMSVLENGFKDFKEGSNK